MFILLDAKGKNELSRILASRSHVLGTLLVAGAILLFWSPALFIPFWQDDFSFLYSAQQEQAQGKSLFAPFFADQIRTFWLIWRKTRSRVTGRGEGSLLLFFLVAGSPYLAFAWNAYAYYVLLGLIAWGILAALADADLKTKGLAMAAALLSSSLAVAGSYLAPYPALIARANWAEKQLALVVSRYETAPEGIYVNVENRHRYLGFGPYGLAYRLGMKREQILEIPPGVPQGKRINPA
ncbi:MAG: hypothetical protein U9Q81_03365 [Pseudomonadota bacterium]|nr:hypothetical protein [Pseudomonadota bacterium]